MVQLPPNPGFPLPRTDGRLKNHSADDGAQANHRGFLIHGFSFGGPGLAGNRAGARRVLKVHRMTVATQIAALEAALATGAVSVTDENGRSVNYGNRKDTAAALAALKATQQEAAAGRAFAINPLKTSGPRN